MYLTQSESLYTRELTLIDDIPFPQYVHYALPENIITKRGIRTVPEELINHLLAKSDIKAFIKNQTQQCRAGFILATGGNIWTGYYPHIKRSDRYPTHKVLPLGMTQVFAGKLANTLGTFEYISTDSSTCISGHSAWHRAKMMLDADMLDMVVVICSDNGISEEYLSIFGDQGISKLATEEDSPDICKFHLGQGCHIGVFESYKSLGKHYRSPLAAIPHISVKGEVHSNPLGVSPTGVGYRDVLKGFPLNKIDFVKTHGTYTKDNAVEEEVVRELCGDIELVNYKLQVGHTMGPSTALETALAIEDHKGTFVSLGAGMGNVFSAALVEIFE